MSDLLLSQHLNPNIVLEPRLIAQNRIVLGDVNGQLQPVFTKLSTLHAKNSFAFAIVSGNLFAEDNDAVSDLLSNKIAVPFPTYFTVGTTPLPQRIIEKIEKDEEVMLDSLECTLKLGLIH